MQAQKSPARTGQDNRQQVDSTAAGAPCQPSRSQRWKSLERTAARKLRGERVVREHMFVKAPDGIVPDFGLIIECKAYRAFAHHTIIEDARRKYCRDGEHVALVTKHAGQQGEYITLPLDFVAALLDEVRAARKGAA